MLEPATPPRPSRRAALALLAAGLAAACGGDGPAGPPPPPVVTIAEGDGQTAEVASTLPLPIAVRVTAGGAPVADATVAFTVTVGGGSLSRPSAQTGADGMARVFWTIGPTAGPQELRASSSGVTATASATGLPGPPLLVMATEGNAQFALVGEAVAAPIRVRVLDPYSNPLDGIPVVFRVAAGAGRITDSVTVTAGGGLATLGSWTLGPGPGLNRLQVSAGLALGEVIATGTAIITALDGQDQVANAGTLLPVSPSVRATDRAGQPVAGAGVTFVVTGGGGSVLEAARVSDAQGIARAGGWILGLAPGVNRLEARSPGVPAAAFSATGVAATPAAAVPEGPVSFHGFLGNYLPDRPAIRVTDALGNPVAGATVTWSATGGGSLVQRGASVTAFDGRAGLAGWRLGPSSPAQEATATVAGLAPVAFAAEAATLPAPAFTVEVRFTGDPPSPGRQAVFAEAAARWGELILGDIPDVRVTAPASFCFPELDEVVDDVLIFAEIVAIDGPNGVLGQAGPCLIRTAGLLTAVGLMRFDAADVAALEASGQFASVILHEMGHVLGIGSLWDIQNLLQNPGSSDPWFSGPTAQAAFIDATGPAGYSGLIVPVENTGGPGTRDGHWRESVLVNELMTGRLNPGANPLSAITVASLRDQGYLVNDAAADSYSLPALLQGLGAPALRLHADPPPEPIGVIGPRGRVERRIPRF